MSPTAERLNEIADEVVRLSRRVQGPRYVKLNVLAGWLRDGDVTRAVDILDAAATWTTSRSDGEAFTALADEFREIGKDEPDPEPVPPVKVQAAQQAAFD